MQYSKLLSAGCKYRASHTTFNELSVSCNVFNISVIILLIVQLLFLLLFSLYVSLVSSLPDKSLITKYYFRYCDILLESPFQGTSSYSLPLQPNCYRYCPLTRFFDSTFGWVSISISPGTNSSSYVYPTLLKQNNQTNLN